MTALPPFKGPLPVAFCPAYALDAGMETVMKSRLLAEMLEAGEAGAVRLFAPEPATEAELGQIHDVAYIAKVLHGTDPYLEFGSWSKEGVASVLLTTGGMRDAVKVALQTGRSGSLSSGLHHARRAYGTGYCTFNGLALAALEGLKTVGRVGILDLDAHFGGGTAEILGDDARVVLADVSVNSFDQWTARDGARHYVECVHDAECYLAAVERACAVLEGVELLIYNAGMDTHENAGGLKGITTEIIRRREARVVAWATQRNVPVLFALAGGYKWGGLTLEGVARLHLETVKAFARE